MKKNIAILGSTGSIGKTTVQIISNEKKSFNVILLTTNKNYSEILKQISKLKPKNLVINNFYYFNKIKKKFKKSKLKIFNNLDDFLKNNKLKIDYTMCAISGIEGLNPILNIIKHSKKVAIANKESIICGWNLINKELKKYNTQFIPVDSEHFSINALLSNNEIDDVEEIIITASGGPLLNFPLKKFYKISPKKAIKHPNWSMGKKISIDSATLMNKVFEILEAQRIFKVDLKRFKIVIHPKSYIHAIIKFKKGLTKILAHDTDMKIPIFNGLYEKTKINLSTKKINFEYLNNLNFQNVNDKKFPSIKFLKLFSNKVSLYETVMIGSNDELVNLFLKNQIKFTDIHILLKKILNSREFLKYRRIEPQNYKQIEDLNKYVRLKTLSLSVLSKKC
tara:strand:+ start:8250 stop:9428 length:1179 start_codon:yes stop_codon:yes gene_type:complete